MDKSYISQAIGYLACIGGHAVVRTAGAHFSNQETLAGTKIYLNADAVTLARKGRNNPAPTRNQTDRAPSR